MKNLLQETIEILSRYNKEAEDVFWVGDKEKYTTWSDFERKSNQDYDNGFGGNEVYDNLIIVGDNWWLERHEYDGSEWWEFKSIPSKPNTKCNIDNMFCGFDNEDFWSK